MKNSRFFDQNYRFFQVFFKISQIPGFSRLFLPKLSNSRLFQVSRYSGNPVYNQIEKYFKKQCKIKCRSTNIENQYNMTKCQQPPKTDQTYFQSGSILKIIKVNCIYKNITTSPTLCKIKSIVLINIFQSPYKTTNRTKQLQMFQNDIKKSRSDFCNYFENNLRAWGI